MSRSVRRGALAALLVGCLTVGWSRAAVAGDAADGAADARRAGAQDALDAGNQRFASGDYEGALKSYQRARELYPSPKLYFNVGQAQRGLGNAVEAVEAYEDFLRDCVDASAELRAEAEGYLHDLDGRVGRLSVTSDVAAAEVLVDDVPKGLTPLPRAIVVLAGAHSVRVRKAGFVTHDEPVTVAPGAALTLTVALVVVPPLPAAASLPEPAPLLSAPPPPPRKPVYERWWFWTGVGALVVAGAVAALYASSSSKLQCPATAEACYGSP